MGSGQSNRLFIILAIALIGLICIGLMGLGGVLYFTQASQAQEVVAIPPTPTSFPSTFTPTPSPTFTPTSTPEPTSTATLVVSNVEETAQVEETSTETPMPTIEATDITAPPTVTPEVIPDSGGVLSAPDNHFLLWIGGGMILVLLVYGGINRFRSSAQTSQESP